MTRRRCLTETEIVQGLDPAKADDRARRRAREHAAACPKCQALLEASREIEVGGREILGSLEGLDLGSQDARLSLRALANAEIRGLRESHRSVRRAIVRPWLAVPAAGTILVLAAVVGLLSVHGPRRLQDRERSSAPQAIALVQPRGPVSAASLVFQWTAREGDRAWRLEIFDRALEPVFQSPPLSSASYALPPSAARLLRDGGVYFWKVVASMDHEQTVESEFARFVVHK